MGTVRIRRSTLASPDAARLIAALAEAFGRSLVEALGRKPMFGKTVDKY